MSGGIDFDRRLWQPTVRVWDGRSGDLMAVLEGHANIILSVSGSSDGMRIVSGCMDFTVRVWDISFVSEWLDLKKDVQSLVKASEDIDTDINEISKIKEPKKDDVDAIEKWKKQSLVIVILKANYYANAVKKFSEKASNIGYPIYFAGEFNKLYKTCIGILENKRKIVDTSSDTSSDTSNKIRKIKLVDSTINLRF